MSRVAAPYAISLAQENQARLVLLHVLPTPKAGKSGKAVGLSVAEACANWMNWCRQREAKLWCRPEPTVGMVMQKREILAAVERSGADLIVLGVRGDGPAGESGDTAGERDFLQHRSARSLPGLDDPRLGDRLADGSVMIKRSFRRRRR